MNKDIKKIWSNLVLTHDLHLQAVCAETTCSFPFYSKNQGLPVAVPFAKQVPCNTSKCYISSQMRTKNPCNFQAILLQNKWGWMKRKYMNKNINS